MPSAFCLDTMACTTFRPLIATSLSHQPLTRNGCPHFRSALRSLVTYQIADGEQRSLRCHPPASTPDGSTIISPTARRNAATRHRRLRTLQPPLPTSHKLGFETRSATVPLAMATAPSSSALREAACLSVPKIGMTKAITMYPPLLPCLPLVCSFPGTL